ncbi:MAG: division/cell wall cluster transcriptional repressor MraZ [Firmicutes bacterium]|nr:division/cell wall cluster transcriptional repressor MraZ [Bacillota bacterium]
MLIGEVDHNIDAKGRYIIPAKFREDLGSRFVLVKGFDSCIFVYPENKWQSVLESLSQLSTTDPKARRFVRSFTARAFDVEADKQFRVVLPQILREHAGMDKEIVTIGAGDRLEIWDKREWAAYNASADATFEEDAACFPEIRL